MYDITSHHMISNDILARYLDLRLSQTLPPQLAFSPLAPLPPRPPRPRSAATSARSDEFATPHHTAASNPPQRSTECKRGLSIIAQDRKYAVPKSDGNATSKLIHCKAEGSNEFWRNLSLFGRRLKHQSSSSLFSPRFPNFS